MEKKQTAVEWLIEYCEREKWPMPSHVIDIAIEMEHRQKIDLLTKYHDRMFYIPYKEGEAETIYNFLNTVEK